MREISEKVHILRRRHLFSTTVRATVVSGTVRAGHMRSLISQCKNSTLCCFEKYIARPFIKGEDKFKVVSFKYTLLVPLLRRKARVVVATQ